MAKGKKMINTKELIADFKDALIGGAYEKALGMVEKQLGEIVPKEAKKFIGGISAFGLRIILDKWGGDFIKNKETLIYLRKKTAGDMLQSMITGFDIPVLNEYTSFIEGIEEDMDSVIENLEIQSYPASLEIQGQSAELYTGIEGVVINGAPANLYGEGNSDSDGGLY